MLVYFIEKITLLAVDKKDSAKTVFITLFASGFGFFLVILTYFGFKQYSSIDLWVTDANNFLLLMGHPHNIFSLALFAGSVYYFFRWVNEKKFWYIAICTALGLLLGFEHLFDMITLYLTIGIFMADYFISKRRIDWKRIVHLLIYGIITIVPFIYTYLLFTSPGFAVWNEQNALSTPKLYQVISGFGLMGFSFVLVMVYFIKNYKTVRPEIRFLIYWVISSSILIYSPLNIQRRFLEGMHIPLGILTGFLIFRIIPKWLPAKIDKKYLGYGQMLLIFLMCITNVYHYADILRGFTSERGDSEFTVNKYLYKEELEGLDWLKRNSEAEAVIVSGYNIGNYIPAFMDRRVYLGHWAQTVKFETKRRDILSFFIQGKKLPLGPPYYVWYGIDEKALNPSFIPEGNEVFKNSKVAIYKIK
jgi:hypothetical protein